jgi:hypothetical protein
LPIFHERFLLTPYLLPETEEISAPPPCGFLIGIYLFYENWSTETFRKNQRSGLFGTPTKSEDGVVLRVDDLRLK